jgi:acetyl-CoA/propionyl-CoA carboxylase biotin carboxyl carrier protein
MPDELTPRQVAIELGVTVRTVQRWIADGRLPSTHVGSRVRVSRSSLSAVTEGAPSAAPSDGPIRTLLVANRGEIATRIARTAHRLGMRVIGIHPPDDRPAAWMDEAHEVPGYLDGEAILAVAARAGADAIHPGYGFLAENPQFGQEVAAAGVRWVGPPAEAIAAMGDKAEARRRAAAHGVPTVPGYDGAAQDDATLADEAERIGFPLLVKPSAGGGGKGMHVVREPGELIESLAAARREAHRSFGDDRLILERYLEGARHVEMQVLFDAAGRGIHLGERDCSAQRRSQKIVEESPAPSLTPELRARIGDAAVAVASAAGYVNAGTVEMLLTDADEFFFLEMNARLQVEHPVTEAVTGRDLVADQLAIAAGATLAELGLEQPPSPRGHAVEARLYAEDPESGFLPATGRVALLRWPTDVRIDTGVAQGDVIGDRYDPMLAKIIAHGPTRGAALERLHAALDETTVLGVRTNLRFLRWLLARLEMRDGEMRTDTIAALELPGPPVPGPEHWQAAAHLATDGSADPWADGWRLNGPAIRRLRHGEEGRAVPVVGPPPPIAAVRDGLTIHVDVTGQSVEFTVAQPPTVESAAAHAAAGAEGAAVLIAPMPGRVIAVRAREGQSVAAGEVVAVIEAMKMEHAVAAPIDGTVERVMVAEGDQVERGAVVAELGPGDGHTLSR